MYTENIKIGQSIDFENLKCSELDQGNHSAVYQFLVINVKEYVYFLHQNKTKQI